MANNKSRSGGGYQDVEAGGKGRFSVDELSELVSEGDMKKLDSMGGVKGITSALRSDPERGIAESEIEERKQQYHT